MDFTRRISNAAENIDENIETLRRATKDKIETLKAQKQRVLSEPNITESCDQKDSEKLQNALEKVDCEINTIQTKYDAAIQQMQEKKMAIKRQLSALENLELLISAISYNIFSTQYEHRQELEKYLQIKQEIINKRLPDESLQLANLELKISEYNKMYETSIINLENQQKAFQQELAKKIITINDDLESSKTIYQNMQAEFQVEKIEASSSHTKKFEQEFSNLKALFESDMIEFTDKQNQGWKTSPSEDYIAELLKCRGLHTTKSGNFITSSGHCLTMNEASRKGLLTGITFPSWTKDLNSGKHILSDDAQYLITALAKPLSLAVEEIIVQKPRDPIHFLVHYLFKYRYNQEFCTKNQKIQDIINGKP